MAFFTLKIQSIIQTSEANTLKIANNMKKINIINVIGTALLIAAIASIFICLAFYSNGNFKVDFLIK